MAELMVVLMAGNLVNFLAVLWADSMADLKACERAEWKVVWTVVQMAVS